MNSIEADILRTLRTKPFINQRMLAEDTHYSLGIVNHSIQTLKTIGYLDAKMNLTAEANQFFHDCAPKRAIILAAGVGMRMVPINQAVPKALLDVNGERLIDRLIRQLHEIGVSEISVVTGFMKDSFEYLIDMYGVDLVYNPAYAIRNNLHSLSLVSGSLHRTYIVPGDLWCSSNPFSDSELYSWYMVSDLMSEESDIRVNRKREIVTSPPNEPGNSMIGICYLLNPQAEAVRENLQNLDDDGHANEFWEAALFLKDRMIVPAKVVESSSIVEINTYEQLRDLDAGSNHLKSDAIQTICTALHCGAKDISNISVLKKGMTNRSFLFSVRDKKYIMRIPGEGTDLLINRQNEAAVFKTIRGYALCDDPVYINPLNGYKITGFLEGVRTCDSKSEQDLEKCMKLLRHFHHLHLSVPHTFDIFRQIEFYESLWNGTPSIFSDYERTKANVMNLRDFVDNAPRDWCLTHIDAIPDNFLFYALPDGSEALQLTDWEYAGMQDPHVDIAMFCIYSLFQKEQCDHLIDLYFEGNCDLITRVKIYAYISMCGLLWSNWCEFKRGLGVEFGEYSLRQYRYAKEFYKYTVELRKELEH